RGAAGVGGPEDRAVRPALARLVPGGLDQAAVGEDLDRAVHERPAERPDRPELAARPERRRERAPVRRALGEEREHRPLPGGEVPDRHRREYARAPASGLPPAAP